MTTRVSKADRLRFAWWFCRTDLFEKVARPVTHAVIAAIALASLASLAALTLPGLVAEQRLRRLAESPLARCVWVSVRPQDPKSGFPKERLGELNQAVQGRLKSQDRPSDGVEVVGFQMLLNNFKYWKKTQPHETDTTPQCKGRTVGRTDPLLAGLPRLLRNGRGFDGPESSGVILSPTFVDYLGGDPNHPPEFLEYREENSGARKKWIVVGVTRDALPFEYEYLITEHEAQVAASSDSREPRTVVFSGPIAEGWPLEWEDYPESLVKKAAGQGINDWNIEVKVLRDPDRMALYQLRLQAPDPLPTDKWLAYLKAIKDEVEKKKGIPGNEEFVSVNQNKDSSSSIPAVPLKPVEHTHAAVYVVNPEDIGPAADATRSLGLYASDAARSLVDEIQAMARQAEAVAIGLVASFCSAGAIALILALYLRGRQKSAQFGMLRALGADDAMLRLVVITEAGYLWLIGSTIGIGLAALAAALAWSTCWVTAADFESAARSRWLIPSIGVYLVGSLAACLLGNLGATAGVRERPASESLGLVA